MFISKSRGVYTLILGLKVSCHLEVGCLGRTFFPAGFYAYTGSARGSGGFKRVVRHLKVATGVNTTRKWHIDYLLPWSRPLAVVLSQKGEECAVASTLGQEFQPVEGFGSTDCKCLSHLHWSQSFEELKETAISAVNLPGSEDYAGMPYSK